MRGKRGRREFVRMVGATAAAAVVPCLGARRRPARRPPNLVLILADDLGYGELGSYGQTRIRTPRLDRLAAEGMRFTQHYAGSPVCAPSRCVLLTGLHSGHAYIRDNDEMEERGDVWHDPALEGQRPLLEGTMTLPRVLQASGYVTGAMGKWGLGGPASTGEPNRQGFDEWFGYLCQRVAHNHYPDHLWRNGERVPLPNPGIFPHQRLPAGADPNDPASYAAYGGGEYAMDAIAQAAREFIRANAARPFFLFLPFTAPHPALQVPEDSLAEYAGAFPDSPYLGERGYLPQRTPRAAHAAMITRMDRAIGSLLDLLVELGLDRDTAVLFTSDNGPSDEGGKDTAFFGSAGGLRGAKSDLYEGGIRVPLLARWPDRIPPGTVSDHACAFWDLLPTLAQLAGARPPGGLDGASFAPALLGRRPQARHAYLYWEFRGRQAVRMERWKAVRAAPDAPFELYDLRTDPGESRDVAAAHPDVIGRVKGILRGARTESELFPLVRPS